MLVAIISGWASPLSATQLLWINLITDSLPAIALGMDPDDPEVMKEVPRKVKSSFFSKLNIFKDLSAGASIGVVTLFAFFFAYREHGHHPAMLSAPEATLSYARTMAFLVLISAQLFYSFALRNPKKSIFTKDMKPNYYLFGALLL